MPLLTILNPENASEQEVVLYTTREAARAIIVDENKNIGLLHVSNKAYYKIPGGGIEGMEDRIAALQRESKEELGCAVEVVGEVGKIIEYRKIFSLKQISYCYFAKVVGEKGVPELTEEEKAAGFEVVWLPYSQVLEAMKNSSAADKEGELYIVPRDIVFLKAAAKWLN